MDYRSAADSLSPSDSPRCRAVAAGGEREKHGRRQRAGHFVVYPAVSLVMGEARPGAREGLDKWP